MKNKLISLIAIVILGSIIFITGCATTPVQKKAFINQAIWSKTTKDQVYAACLTALQMEGFDINPLGINKESGLIITGQVSFYPFEKYYLVMGYYKLQILISESQDEKITLDINTTAGSKKVDPGAWGYNKDDLHNRINNKVSDDLGRLFARLDILLGKAEYYRGDRVLVWE
ncbi:hypothetical protein J7M07_03600 [bacterium]|nr:hypothetical protein [bacterium]